MHLHGATHDWPPHRVPCPGQPRGDPSWKQNFTFHCWLFSYGVFRALAMRALICRVSALLWGLAGGAVAGFPPCLDALVHAASAALRAQGAACASVTFCGKRDWLSGAELLSACRHLTYFGSVNGSSYQLNECMTLVQVSNVAGACSVFASAPHERAQKCRPTLKEYCYARAQNRVSRREGSAARVYFGKTATWQPAKLQVYGTMPEHDKKQQWH